MLPTLAESTNAGNHAVPSAGPVMPFGRYRGTPLAELPSEYCCGWVAWMTCGSRLLKHVLHEMGRRLAAIEAQEVTHGQ